MKSKYITLLELRKEMLYKGDREKADELWMKAMELRRSGKVSAEEIKAAAYL